MGAFQGPCHDDSVALHLVKLLSVRESLCKQRIGLGVAAGDGMYLRDMSSHSMLVIYAVKYP
jgi:hypothetical protein